MEDTQKKLFQTHVNQRNGIDFWTLWERGFVVAVVVVVVVVVVVCWFFVVVGFCCLCVLVCVFCCCCFGVRLFVHTCVRAGVRASE